MIIHGHLISLNRGCIVFCCRDFLEVFLTDDTRPTWSPRGLCFLSNNHSFQSNPMAVIILMVNTPRFLSAMLCFPVNNIMICLLIHFCFHRFLRIPLQPHIFEETPNPTNPLWLSCRRKTIHPRIWGFDTVRPTVCA